MRIREAGFALGMAACVATAAAAQEEAPLGPVRLEAGLHLIGAKPVGEFDDYIDGGVGLGAHVDWPVQPGSWLSLRADLGWILYGEETIDVCIEGLCRVGLELTTTNNIFFFGAGPQLAAPAGPIRPYVNATGGFAYFATNSSLKGDDNNQNFASDTNYDDITLAWTAGGGIRIPVSSGRTPVLIDLGAQYHGNGSVEYLTEGDIEDNPSGPPTLNVNRSEANFISFRLGVTLGFRPGS